MEEDNFQCGLDEEEQPGANSLLELVASFHRDSNLS
jgi:hypothetical protein